MLPITYGFYSQPTVFLPTNTTLWLKADAATASSDTNNMNTVSSTGSITRFFDFSGNGYHYSLTQSEVANWQSNQINSLPAFSFTGTAKYQSSTLPPTSGSRELFMVAMPVGTFSSSSLENYLFIQNGPTTDFIITSYRFRNNSFTQSDGFWGFQSGTSPVMATASVGQWIIMQGIGGSTSKINNVDMGFRSGQDGYSQFIQYPNISRLGSLNAGVNYKLAEIIYYNRSLSTSERNQVVDYLKNKYNISF